MVFDPSVYERLAILEAKLLVLQAELQAKQEELRAEQAVKQLENQIERRAERDKLKMLGERVDAIERHGLSHVLPQPGNVMKLQESTIQPYEAAHMVQEHQGQVINYYFPIEVEVLGTLSEVEVQRFTRYVYDELLIAVQSQAPQVE